MDPISSREAMGERGRNRSPGFAQKAGFSGAVPLRDPCGVRRFARTRLVWLVAAALATAAGVLVLSGDEEGGGPRSPPSSRASPPSRGSRLRGSSTRPRGEPPRRTRRGPAPPSRRRSVPRRPRASTPASARWRGSSAPTWRRSTPATAGASAGCSSPAPWRRSTSRATGAAAPPRCRPRSDTGTRAGSPSMTARGSARIPSVTDRRLGRRRVVATTVTHFAGNREPSVEDDLIYLRNEGGRWLIVKPSATLYRAIGVGRHPAAGRWRRRDGRLALDRDDLRSAAAEQGDEAAPARRARSTRAGDRSPCE